MELNNTKNTVLRRLTALALAAAMAVGPVPTGTFAAEPTGLTAGQVVTEDDPETLGRHEEIYGDNTLNSGKVTVGKSVTDLKADDTSTATLDLSSEAAGAVWTADDLEDVNNFLVTVTQTAQVHGVSSEIPVPLDVVFVLDTSGSMRQPYDGTFADSRAYDAVNAVNDAIETLMAINENNRVSVVAFSGHNSDWSNENSTSADNDAANVLSPLAHYTGAAASEHLTWTNDILQGRTTTGQKGNTRHGHSGGTNIQAGIALGAQQLLNVSDTSVTVEGQTVKRMPFLIVVSDGAPTMSSASQTWWQPESLHYQGDLGNPYAGNGFLPALTAAYYKEAISQKYYPDGGGDATIYTIGVMLDNENKSETSSTMSDLARMTLNPLEYFREGSTNQYYTDFASYWASYTAGRTFGIKVDSDQYFENLNGEDDSRQRTSRHDGYYYFYPAATTVRNPNYYKVYQDNDNDSQLDYDWAAGSTSVIDNIQESVTSLAYNDKYYDVMDSDDLADVFKELVIEIQKKAISSPTYIEMDLSAEYSGYITFTDVLGEYMEFKDLKGVLGEGYLYQGRAFANYMKNWSDNATGNQAAFQQAFMDSITNRILAIYEGEEDVETVTAELIANALASDKQLYYNSADDYDNSICWFGNAFTNSDGVYSVQYISPADDDSVGYIASSADIAAAKADGANTVNRSYFIYGIEGGVVEEPRDYLKFIVRVSRSLEAPYQQTVTISAPASLLSAEKILVDDTTLEGKIEAHVESANPARVIYEVGLREDITAENAAGIISASYKAQAGNVNADGSYNFYTNDWDPTKPVDSHERAMTTATFEVSDENKFYVYQEDAKLYADNKGTALTGAAQAGGTYYYVREYYDWTNAKQNADGTYDAVKKTAYIAVTLPTDTTELAAILTDNGTAIKAGTYEASTLSVAQDDWLKSANETDTSVIVAHPTRTNDHTDRHYTVYLGNNGRLTLKPVQPKQVLNDAGQDIDGDTVMVGDTLTYEILVANSDNANAASAVVTDTVPTGTALVAGSAAVYDENGDALSADNYVFANENGKLTWTIGGEGDLKIPAGATWTVSFQVTVRPEAIHGGSTGSAVDSITNTATVKVGNDPAYTTNTTSNPPEGKVALDESGNDLQTGSLQVGDVLTYKIRYYNDTGAAATVTVTDTIPAGTVYVENSASHGGTLSNGKLTWTIGNVPAASGGTVTFQVAVDASAKTPLSNSAIISIGDNDPTNTVTNTLKTGDLQLSKVVTDDTANTTPFTLTLTEESGKLSGTYTVQVTENGAAAADTTVTFKDGTATLTIRNGQTLVIKGLPAGASILVEETSIPGGYTPKYSVSVGSAAPAQSDTAPTVTISGSVTAVVVRNTYAAQPVSVDFGGSKTFTSATAGDVTETFGFVARACDENGVLLTGDAAETLSDSASVAVGGSGSFTFSKRFTAAGTYYYLVTEANGSVNGVSYDGTQYLYTVTIRDNGAGQLVKQSESWQKRASASETWATATAAAFANTYTKPTTSISLQVNKELSGRTLKNGEFGFQLKEGSTVVGAVTNAADGTVTFAPIEYTATGVHTYTITEPKGTDPQVSYDDLTVTVTVTVTQNTDGSLSAAASYPTDITFNNTFTPQDTTASLTGTKTLKGRALGVDEFNFEVVEVDESGNEKTPRNVAATGHNTAGSAFDGTSSSGSISFGDLHYTAASLGGAASKDFYYKVVEVKPNLSPLEDVTYSDAVFYIKVTVTNTDGVLSTKTLYKNGDSYVETSNIAFENTYTPEPIYVAPTAVKSTQKADGTAFDGGTFSFGIYTDLACTTLAAQGSGAANGNVTFSGVLVSGTGDHTYYIRETNAGQDLNNGITYDKTVYQWTFTVANVNGTLQKVSGSDVYTRIVNAAGTTVSEPVTGTPSFANTYAAAGGVTLTSRKAVSGAYTLGAGDFDFLLTGVTFTPVGGTAAAYTYTSTGTNAADGTITFDTIYYTEPGVYTYTMTEVIPDPQLTGMTYDQSEYTVTVTVTDDGAGTLTAEVTGITQVKDAEGKTVSQTIAPTADTAYIPGADGAAFTNTYAKLGTEVTIEADKTLSGRTLKDGEFSFELVYIDGQNKQTVVATEKNSNGKVTFTRKYPNGTATGEYKYIIREVDARADGVTYDPDTIQVTVTITDADNDGRLEATAAYGDKTGFTNAYTPDAIQLDLLGYKTLTGRTLKNNEFGFVVEQKQSDNSWKAVAAGQNAADGTVTFGTLTLPAAGTYEYRISETAGTLGGVTYDKTVHAVTVTVGTDSTTGALVISSIKVDGSAYDLAKAKDGDLTVLKQLGFTNTYKAAGTLSLTASKTLTGRDMTAGEFHFTVTDENGKPVAVGTNAAAKDGKAAQITFSGFGGYTQEDVGKTYTYTIAEISGSLTGVTYDSSSFQVTVKVTDKGDGTLETDITYPTGGVNFQNTYQPEKTSATLQGRKTLIGKALKAGDFTFVLTDKDSKKTELTNKADGTLDFPELEYTAAGTYTYTLTEKASYAGTLPDGAVMHYDQSEYTITVTVADQNGRLAVTSVAYQTKDSTAPNAALFTNTYDPAPIEVGAQIQLNKTLTGRDMKEGESFTFQLLNVSGEAVTGKDGKPVTAVVTGGKDGKSVTAAFSAFTLDKAGTYHYNIVEVAGDADGVTYDETAWHVHVIVTHDQQAGTLGARVEYLTSQAASAADSHEGDDDLPAFTNTYTPDPVSLVVKGVKTLTGRDIKAGEFTFHLMKGTAIVSEAKNAADGSITFPTLTLDATGSYEYTVREHDAGETGVTYDTTAYTLTLQVEDNKDGELEVKSAAIDGTPVTVSTDGGITAITLPGASSFTNSYKGLPVLAQVEAHKVLTGKQLQDSEFQFKLVDERGNIFLSKNNAEGGIVFGQFMYSDAGTYTYTMSEVPVDDTHYVCDTSSYTVTVTVIDDMKGHLEASVSYDTADGAAPIFRNTYIPDPIPVTLEAYKTLTGRALQDGEFTFSAVCLTSPEDRLNGTAVTGRNAADGSITFAPYELELIGTYTFRLTETNNALPYVSYDGSAHIVTVEVTDQDNNGVLEATVTYPDSGASFRNTYDEPEDPAPTPTPAGRLIPQTGDDAPIGLLAVLAVLGGGGLAGVTLLRKKNRKEEE